MSIRNELGTKYKNLGIILEPYIKGLEEKKEHIKIEGKSLGLACREQASWHLYYSERKVELQQLVRFFEMELRIVRARLLVEMEKKQLAINDTTKNKYIDGHPDYTKVEELLLEVKEIHEEYAEVTETFRYRGYSLNNLTKLKISELEDAIS